MPKDVTLGTGPDFSTAKLNFDSVYDEATPVAYAEALGAVDYVIPQNARSVLVGLIEKIRTRSGRTPRILDVGCSFGINTYMVRHELSLNAVYDHYRRHGRLRHEPAALKRADIELLSGLPIRRSVHMIGLDRSANALHYAHEVGLLDEVVPVDDDRRPLDVDAVVSTGAIGYVDARQLGDIVGRCSRPEVWIANFVLRTIDYSPFADVLESYGFTTATSSHLFEQRSTEGKEMKAAVEQIRRRGLDASRWEAQGRLCAHFFLSGRSRAETADLCATLTPPG